MTHLFSRFARCAPPLAVVLWCLFVGIAVWQHVQRSEQPPIHDAQTYFRKAQSFWNAVHERNWANPLNLEPTFRPPGTVLMSYPFGFSLDFHGFYFRSIYLPVLLLVLAAYVAVWHQRIADKRSRRLALAAVFLTSLPSIYQFELIADEIVPSHFGLVDNFLMGLAALAAAASLRSLATRSLAWVAVTAAIASLCVLVKPSGAYVMALTGANWLLLALAQVRGAQESIPQRETRPTRAWLMKCVGLFAVFYLATLGACLSSQYLSAQNLAFGTGAIAIMQSDWTLVPGALELLIRTSTGYALPLLALTILGLALPHRKHLPPRTPVLNGLSEDGLALAAVTTLAFGIWFWVFGSGGLYSARYFMPFAAMAAVYGLPIALEAVDRLSRWQAACVQTLCVLPVLNLALLLVQIHPPDGWQKAAGVNLASGAPNPVMDQARSFLRGIAAGGRGVSLYAMPLVGLTDSTFQAFADYQRAINPRTPAVSMRRPIDWIRSSTYRLTELLASDFILFEPVTDRELRGKIFAKPSIDTLEEERLLLQAWATGLSTADGVHLVSATPVSWLLRIDDKARLEASLSMLEEQHRWRHVFLEANPRRWWSRRELSRELGAHRVALSDASFGERFQVRALEVNSSEVEITVKLWWERLDAAAGADWFFFVHALDERKGIVLKTQIALTDWIPRSAEETIRFDTLTFRKPPYGSVAALGVGVYRASDKQLLQANTGDRDWNDTRVILPVR